MTQARMFPILSARLARSNAEQFPDILALYLPPPAAVLDMTFGNGVFWQNVTGYEVTANDVDPERGDSHHDFRHLPEEWGGRFDACVLDPPYLGVGGIETLKDSIDRGYNNRKRAKSSVAGIGGVRRLYGGAVIEAHRVLKRSGILIVKVMDQIETDELRLISYDVIELARIFGFKHLAEHIFVNQNTPTLRHDHQVHARHNHSKWEIFKRRP